MMLQYYCSHLSIRYAPAINQHARQNFVRAVALERHHQLVDVDPPPAVSTVINWEAAPTAFDARPGKTEQPVDRTRDLLRVKQTL